MECPELTGRFVRLEPLAGEHREGLRAAADDDRVWEFMTLLGRGPDFDRWFDEALRIASLASAVPFAVRLLANGELIGAPAISIPSSFTAASRSAGRGTGPTSGPVRSTPSPSCSC